MKSAPAQKRLTVYNRLCRTQERMKDKNKWRSLSTLLKKKIHNCEETQKTSVKLKTDKSKQSLLEIKEFNMSIRENSTGNRIFFRLW